MNHRFARRQRGISFGGMVTLIIVLALGGLLVARIVPTFVEYQGVKRAVSKAAAGATPNEVRAIFDKAADVETITSIQSKDLDIGKNAAGEVVVKFAYTREIPLVANAYLLLKYDGQSRQGSGSL